MNKACIVQKKKVILCYKLLVLSFVFFILASFSPIFVIVAIGLFTSVHVVSFKYLNCSYCNTFIGLAGMTYTATKYCRCCGCAIEYE